MADHRHVGDAAIIIVTIINVTYMAQVRIVRLLAVP